MIDRPLQGWCLLVPAYKPDSKLLKMLRQFITIRPDIPIIVVNDGSGVEYDDYFLQASDLGAVVLNHPLNRGKGAALKTGMRHYMDNYSSNALGVVTADADGQHLTDDIIRVAQALERQPQSLHLGVRDHNAEKVPLRSALGNKLTKIIFNKAMRTRIRDTQTGLRAVPNQLLKCTLDTNSSGYEFEFEMLFLAKAQCISINQVSIDTVYIDNNAQSHFRPLRDSIKIYSIFARFCGVSILSFALDYILFALLFYFGHSLIVAVGLSRMTSAFFNFSLNKNQVFSHKGKYLPALVKYFSLVIFIGGLSFLLLRYAAMLGGNVYISKLFVDVTLFFISYAMQKHIVFTKSFS